MKKVNVELIESKSGHVLLEWNNVQSAQILDIEYSKALRTVKILKKDGGNVFVMPAFNNTLIIEEIVE